MKKTLLLSLLPIALCSCRNNPRYYIGDWANVHEHYKAMIVSDPEIVSSFFYTDKNGEQQIAEENGISYLRLDLKIKRDRVDGKGHKLDCDDFKLCDGIGTVQGGLEDKKAYKDYTWFGKEIMPDEEFSFTVSFSTKSDKAEQYKYLQIDFKISGGNSTSIYLKTQNSK